MESNNIYFVGLGNSPRQYILTRHNIGMDLIKNIEKENAFTLVEKINRRNYLLKKLLYEGIYFYTVKLKTYMNLSGQVLKNFCTKEKVDITQLCIIVDDFNLEFGKFRIRLKGSSGNHKGLQSIIDIFGTNNFARIRIGIGPLNGIAEDFVLQKFNKEELKKLPQLAKTLNFIIQTILKEGFVKAMNNFNR